MAIKAPTPPTPPTVPVVPGAEQQSDGGQSMQAGQSAGNGQDNGREFGVHVTISNPKENNGGAAAQQGASTQSTGNGQGSEPQANTQTAAQTGQQNNEAQADVAQQARQDMVQQALGIKDGDDAKQGQESAQQSVTESPWPLSGSHISAMSFMPVLIVFVAAFITFMLRNLSKKPKLSKKTLGKGKGQPPAQNVYREKSTAKNDKKNKGSHFEMRI